MKIYTIERSNDRVKWRFCASFKEGDFSRFNKPFNADIALQEAKSFREFYGEKIKFIRVIIEV